MHDGLGQKVGYFHGEIHNQPTAIKKFDLNISSHYKLIFLATDWEPSAAQAVTSK